MKIVTIAAYVLASAIVCFGALLATRDYTTVEKDFFSLGYTVTWGSRSFDEAVWQAVTEMATLEENLPDEVENFRVAVVPSNNDYAVVYIDFNRDDLDSLKEGTISPEIFIREYVSFK